VETKTAGKDFLLGKYNHAFAKGEKGRAVGQEGEFWADIGVRQKVIRGEGKAIRKEFAPRSYPGEEILETVQDQNRRALIRGVS